MSHRLDVVLLLALPAAGKSEVRRYLEHLDPAAAENDMCVRPAAQLDDYPYVHFMRRVDQELVERGAEPVFFRSLASPWRFAGDWLTLIHLLNEDHAALAGGAASEPGPEAAFARIDDARAQAGVEPAFAALEPKLRAELAAALAGDAAALTASTTATDAEGTIVIEFARGGPSGAEMPLPPPLGYAASLAALDEEIITRAAILYVWVDPEESRRRNRERAVPDGDASILHHGVPDEVMRLEYGCDDIGWLESQARRPGTIRIGDHDIPLARFDNRRDRTSFLRDDPARWPPQQVARLHDDLASAFTMLAGLLRG